MPISEWLSLPVLLAIGAFIAAGLIVWSWFLEKDSPYKVEMFKIGFAFILVGITGAAVQQGLSSQSFQQNTSYELGQQDLATNEKLVSDIEGLINQRLSAAKHVINAYWEEQRDGEAWKRYEESSIEWGTRVSTYHDLIKDFAGEKVANELYLNDDAATTTIHYLFGQADFRLQGVRSMLEYLSASSTREFSPSYYQTYHASLDGAERIVDKQLADQKERFLKALKAALDEKRKEFRASVGSEHR